MHSSNTLTDLRSQQVAVNPLLVTVALASRLVSDLSTSGPSGSELEPGRYCVTLDASPLMSVARHSASGGAAYGRCEDFLHLIWNRDTFSSRSQSPLYRSLTVAGESGQPKANLVAVPVASIRRGSLLESCLRNLSNFPRAVLGSMTLSYNSDQRARRTCWKQLARVGLPSKERTSPERRIVKKGNIDV